MNILVTGGAGYIGSHVAKTLMELGHNTIVLDNLTTGHIDSITGIPFYKGDTEDKGLITKVLIENKIEAVMHFAADSRVAESMCDPGKYFYNNVGKGMALMDAIANSSVRHILFSSTAAVYGEPISIPITEDHNTNPTNVYGETKLMFEKILKWYDLIFGIKYTSLRYFNAAGADESGKIGEDHDPETHLIPIVMQTCNGYRDNIQIYGNDYPTPDGTCIRDYIHVKDISDAHILAIESLRKNNHSKIYNLGSGTGYSVKQVIEESQKITGKTIKVNYSQRRKGDPAILVASSEKIRNELGWLPKYNNLNEIIETAWKWHKSNPNGYSKGR